MFKINIRSNHSILVLVFIFLFRFLSFFFNRKVISVHNCHSVHSPMYTMSLVKMNLFGDYSVHTVRQLLLSNPVKREKGLGDVVFVSEGWRSDMTGWMGNIGHPVAPDDDRYCVRSRKSPHWLMVRKQHKTKRCFCSMDASPERFILNIGTCSLQLTLFEH